MDTLHWQCFDLISEYSSDYQGRPLQSFTLRNPDLLRQYKSFKKSLTRFINSAMFRLKFFDVVATRREKGVVLTAD
jgi:hypothetical protein